MVFFWIAVVAVGLINRIVTAVSVIGNARSRMGKESAGPSSMSTRFRRNISLPATFGYSHARSIFWCTIPLRIQSLTIFLFLLINVVFCISGYRFVDGNF
jgi:hypothetical protein